MSEFCGTEGCKVQTNILLLYMHLTQINVPTSPTQPSLSPKQPNSAILLKYDHKPVKTQDLSVDCKNQGEGRRERDRD